METGTHRVYEMLQRSYFAVDGLWFVMAEEQFGREKALELDEKVWQVMAKIQARKARELLEIDGDSPAELARCIALKFEAEGHDYHVKIENKDAAEIVITQCPWRDALLSSDRAELGPAIARRICAHEGAGWAAEFSPRIKFELTETLCEGAERCCLRFRQPSTGTETD